MCLHYFIWSFILEEFDDVKRRRLTTRGVSNSWNEFLGNMWNILDLLGYLLYLIALLTRFIPTENFFIFSK